MTVQDIIKRVQETRAPRVQTQTVVRWLNDAEQMVKDVMDRFEDGDDYPFVPYTEDALDRALLAPDLFRELYVWYCVHQIDLLENQQDNANNSLLQYGTSFQRFQNYWVRNHMPKTRAKIHMEDFNV